MLFTVAQVPGAKRYLPRSGPGAGPTSKVITALRAEMTHLNTRLLEIEREQRVQFELIVQIQQQLDEIRRLLNRRAPPSPE
jgi:hypothetical protein